MGRIKLTFCGVCENENPDCLTCQGRWQEKPIPQWLRGYALYFNIIEDAIQTERLALWLEKRTVHAE